MAKPREGHDYIIDVVDGRRQPDPNWTGKMLVGKGDKIKPVLANVGLALRASPEWIGALAYDEFRLELMLSKPAPWDIAVNFKARTWTEHDKLKATEWMNHQGIDVPESITHQAVMMVAREASFHPVKQYLIGLQWDRKPRVDSWLTDYLGADANPYVSAVGRRFLIGSIARVIRPGAKVDTMLILEGEQGAGKSTALKMLGGDWFTDEIADLGSKDAALQMRGVWLIEFSELDVMLRKEAATVKAFMSRTNDRYRPPFERYIIDVPRQCIFSGTTNASGYLKDETGARRFWPVKVKGLNAKRLAEDRDQLFAEAMALFREQQPWWLESDELVRVAADEQADRYAGDPWTDKVLGYAQGRADLAIPDILSHCLLIEPARCGQAEQNRVARILTAAGWSRRQVRTAVGRTWRYFVGDVSPVASGDTG